jgi:23S rRNA pseudouridine2605 synthase
VKNNKRDKKHPLAEKVDKAFKGKKKTETGKKYPSDDKPGDSSRGKSKSTSTGTRYTGLGKKHKGAEKTEPRNFKSKPGTRTGSGSTKSRNTTDANKRFGKADGDSKRTGSRDRKPAFGTGDGSKSTPREKPSFGTKPRTGTGTGKTFDDRKRSDNRKDKPERRDRETPEKFKKEGTEKRPYGKDSENTKGKSYGAKNKTPERYKRRTTTSPDVLKKRTSEESGDGSIRLNRYIANSGICSRRDADELISQGLVEVNGKVVTEMGYKVNPGDVVRYDGGTLKREQSVYLLLNKPKDFITTMDDPQERKTVMQLIAGACNERVYPVGRLDRNTTGLLILTNDGELAEKLTHPSNKIAKVYQVELDRALEREDFNKIEAGDVILEDGPVKVDAIAYGEGTKKVLGLEIHEGRNRIVRRIFEHLGYDVERLDRTMYAGLTKKDLPRGNWRFLTEKEVIRLKQQR